MVPPLDNDTINTVSQVHNSSMTPGEALIQILREHENFVHDIRRNQIDINEFGDESATGTVTVKNPIRRPILVTDIIATWKTTTIGVQAIALNPPTAGVNQIVLGASGAATENNNPFTVVQTVSGGTVTVIAINGTPTGQTSGTFFIPPEGTIAVTYTVAPTTFSTAASASLNNNPFPVQVNVQGGTVTEILVNGIPTGLTSGIIFVPAQGTIEVIYSVAPTTFTTGAIGAPGTPQIAAGIATLQAGGRTYQLPYTQGNFILSGIHGLQLDNTSNNNSMTLTVTPATAVHLEFAGYADYRKVERN